MLIPTFSPHAGRRRAPSARTAHHFTTAVPCYAHRYTENTAMQIELHVNGKAQVIEIDDPGMPLLYALRDDLGLNNPRLGCWLGERGARTLHRGGRPVRACETPHA